VLDRLHAKLDVALKKSFDSTIDLYKSYSFHEANENGYKSSYQGHLDIYNGKSYLPYNEKKKLQVILL